MFAFRARHTMHIQKYKPTTLLCKVLQFLTRPCLSRARQENGATSKRAGARKGEDNTRSGAAEAGPDKRASYKFRELLQQRPNEDDT